MKIIKTDYQNKNYWKESEVESTKVGCMNLVKLYPDYRGQKMQGFGGAFTEASAFNYGILTKEEKEAFLHAYFSEDGLGYNLGRTHMNSCDFSLSPYAAIHEGDEDLSTFSMKREEKYLIPFIKEVQEYCGKNVPLLLSPWSPPGFMKENGEMKNGGKLKKEYGAAWAAYMAKYIKELKLRGLNIEFLSVQNEPDAVQTWESCLYTAKEEMEFVRDHLGPILEQEGLSQVKILVWDHNKEAVYERAREIFGDPKADGYIYGMGVHWYTGDHFEALSLVKEQFPKKELFFTEGCVEYSRFGDTGQVSRAEMYAHDMIGNFNHGVSAFYDWNLLLDDQGGPNHVGNYCDAPIMLTQEHCILKNLSYYYIGHFSRYIKEGACRIGVTRYTSDIEACAFLNPDQERVVVLLNPHKEERKVTIGEEGMGREVVLDPHTIVTICYYK